MSTARKKKPAKPRRKFAESRIYADEPDFLGFEDLPADGGSWIKAEKQPDGVFIDSAHFVPGFRLHPAHARLLGKRLIRWADELEGKR